MIDTNGIILTSLPNYNTTEEKLCVSKTKKDLPYALSYNIERKAFEFSQLDLLRQEQPNEADIITITFENPMGTQFSMTGSANTRVLTRDFGYKHIKYINPIDVVVDSEKRLCKLVSKKPTELKPGDEFCSVYSKHNENIIYNNLIIKC